MIGGSFVLSPRRPMEVQQFVNIFEAGLIKNSENITAEQIDKETNIGFSTWFEAYVFDPANNINDERLKNLAIGPYKLVQTWPQYFTNGFRFDTLSCGSHKSTMNSGVCIKGKSWSDYESDYYGLLDEVIQLEYSNPSIKRTTLVLFKCDWFDPTLERGLKVHNRFGLVEINHKKKFSSYAYEPFVLAEQVQQVYFAEYPNKKKDRADWWVVCKINARSRIDCPSVPYQEDDGFPSLLSNADDLDCLRHETGEMEEHDIEEERTQDIEEERTQEIGDVENDNEMEESDFDSEDERDAQSDGTDYSE